MSSDVAGKESLVMSLIKIVRPSCDVLYLSIFKAVLVAAFSSKKLLLDREKQTEGCVARAVWSLTLK